MILNPAWVSYEPIIQAAGGVTVRVNLDYAQSYMITAEALEQAYSDKTRLLVINYPNNPTGRILHENEADVLEQFMLLHPNIYLLSDEVYEKIVFDGSKSISMASRASVQERVITVNGFSKCVAMTGWRMGYMTANKEVFQAANKLCQHSLNCMSGFMQKGAVAAFGCQAEIEQMRRVYQERRDMFVGALNQIKGVHCELPEGAFYAWVFFDAKGMDSTQVSEYLLENAKVVGLPGSAFGEEHACCLRFSFATATEDLRTAAERIREAIEKLN